MEFYFSGFRCDVHDDFWGYQGGKALGTRPSVYVDLEAHRRATPVLRELIFRGGVIITHVELEEQHVDFLTQPLSNAFFCYHRDFLMNI